MKHNEADILIVAAGPAGLAAAVSAAAAGAKVKVFEKMKTTGGTANMAMGPFGVESRVQKKQIEPLTKKKVFDIFMDYSHWHTDSRLVKAYVDKSGDTINWLEDLGVEWYGAVRHFPDSEATWHLPKLSNGSFGHGSGAVIMKALKDKADELGVEFFLETPVKKLLTENGTVVGLQAVTADGKEIEERGKAVIIATGGFGSNPQMVFEETGYKLFETLYSFMVPGIDGDGIKMAREVGAAKDNVNMEMCIAFTKVMEYETIDAVCRQPNLLVNLDGNRFFNEYQLCNTTYAGNAITRQRGSAAYVIFDESTKRYYEKNGYDFRALDVTPANMDNFDAEVERYTKEINGNDFIVADSIEELAEKTGIDFENLCDTVDEYNQHCDSYDKLYHKDPKYMRPIRKGKIYAGKIIPIAFGSLGGIKINAYCEAINANADIIPGLYAAGSDANSLHRDSYAFVLPGNSMGFAINSGRIAGESAADYVEYLKEQ